jgi:hypothetical protein
MKAVELEFRRIGHGPHPLTKRQFMDCLQQYLDKTALNIFTQEYDSVMARTETLPAEPALEGVAGRREVLAMEAQPEGVNPDGTVRPAIPAVAYVAPVQAVAPKPALPERTVPLVDPIQAFFDVLLSQYQYQDAAKMAELDNFRDLFLGETALQKAQRLSALRLMFPIGANDQLAMTKFLNSFPDVIKERIIAQVNSEYPKEELRYDRVVATALSDERQRAMLNIHGVTKAGPSTGPSAPRTVPPQSRASTSAGTATTTATTGTGPTAIAVCFNCQSPGHGWRACPHERRPDFIPPAPSWVVRQEKRAQKAASLHTVPPPTAAPTAQVPHA